MPLILVASENHRQPTGQPPICSQSEENSLLYWEDLEEIPRSEQSTSQNSKQLFKNRSSKDTRCRTRRPGRSLRRRRR